jgi:hypothetical protein
MSNQAFEVSGIPDRYVGRTCTMSPHARLGWQQQAKAIEYAAHQIVI